MCITDRTVKRQGLCPVVVGHVVLIRFDEGKDEPLFRKAPFAYILSDQAFGVTMSHFANELPANPAWYYYGAAAAVWAVWNASAVVGAWKCCIPYRKT